MLSSLAFVVGIGVEPWSLVSAVPVELLPNGLSSYLDHIQGNAHRAEVLIAHLLECLLSCYAMRMPVPDVVAVLS